jgi:hypothetical protein
MEIYYELQAGGRGSDCSDVSVETCVHRVGHFTVGEIRSSQAGLCAELREVGLHVRLRDMRFLQRWL